MESSQNKTKSKANKTEKEDFQDNIKLGQKDEEENSNEEEANKNDDDDDFTSFPFDIPIPEEPKDAINFYNKK